MVRALRPADAGATEHIVYLAIGGMTNLAISQGPVCGFTRVIASGIEQIAADVSARCGVSLGAARQLLSARGSGPVTVSRPLVSSDPALRVADVQSGGIEPIETAVPSGPERDALVRTAFEEGVRRIAAEVRNSLDFYVSTQGGSAATRAVLCGPALEIKGFEDALSHELGIPIARGEVALASSEAAGGVPLSLLAVAAGLSVPEGPP
jgi:Tfp pilus assembly PilM family ATPase